MNSTTVKKPRIATQKAAGRKKMPDLWLRAIPVSKNHGSGILQKKLWRLCSDYVRIRDWYKFGGECVATGKYIQSWQEGQAGHFISYSKCNGMFKFSVANIHMQSANSNAFGDRDHWNQYEAELRNRYGEEFIETLEMTNRHSSLKFSTGEITGLMKELLMQMGTLEEQPEYYQRAMSLLNP